MKKVKLWFVVKYEGSDGWLVPNPKSASGLGIHSLQIENPYSRHEAIKENPEAYLKRYVGDNELIIWSLGKNPGRAIKKYIKIINDMTDTAELISV